MATAAQFIDGEGRTVVRLRCDGCGVEGIAGEHAGHPLGWGTRDVEAALSGDERAEFEAIYGDSFQRAMIELDYCPECVARTPGAYVVPGFVPDVEPPVEDPAGRNVLVVLDAI